MSVHWRPVGPEAAPTYWQRRAVLVVGLLLVLLFLRAVTTGAGDEGGDMLASATPSTAPAPAAGAPGAASSPAPANSPGVSATASPGASGAAAPGASAAAAAGDCEPADLDISVQAQQDAYPVGARPLLELRIENTGTAPCRRDLGQAAVEIVVVSGPDRIWSSDDCAPGGAAKPAVLPPGEPVVTRLTWAGRRSLPGCTGDKEQAEAGTYRTQARVGQLTVDGDPFRFTKG